MGTRRKRERAHLQSVLLQEITTLEKNHNTQQSPILFHSLTLKRQELKAPFHSEQKKHFRLISQRICEWGNKPSCYWLHSLLQQKKLASFHKTTEDRSVRGAMIQGYLTQAHLLKVPLTSLKALECEITTSELRTTLKSMANGKASGPDGLTIAYYQDFQDMLLPRLLAHANSIYEGGTLRTEILHAHITILPKPGKDPSLCGSYRPGFSVEHRRKVVY